jgi:hypothetical protein
MMTLREYFDDAEGHGVLAAADAAGKVDVTVYVLPHVMDEKKVAFIMAERYEGGSGAVRRAQTVRRGPAFVTPSMEGPR